MQRPQPTHLLWSMEAFRSVIVIALWAQFLRQAPQPTQRSCTTWGLPALCISILPARNRSPCRCFSGCRRNRAFMSFEMGQGNKDIGVHDGPADLGFLDIVSIDGHQGLVGAFQAVGDDDMTAGGKGIVAVFIGGVQMIQGVLAAADVQGMQSVKKTRPPWALIKSTKTLE